MSFSVGVMSTTHWRIWLVSVISLGSHTQTNIVWGEERSVPVISTDIQTIIDGHPTAMAMIGDVTPGDVLAVKLLLYNQTDRRIEFNSIATTCSCQEIEPNEGAIGVGEAIAISMKVRTIDTPLSGKSGGRISFTENGQVSFELAFEYSFSKYAGFKSNLIVVSATKDSLREGVEFFIPIVKGSSVESSAIDFRLDGIDCDFSWHQTTSRVIGHSVAVGKLILKPRLVDDGFARLFGELTLLRLDGGKLATVPFVVKKSDGLQVIPRMIRFLAPDDQGDCLASTYVLSKGSPDKPSSCSVTAAIYGVEVPCTVSSLASEKFRVELRISKEKRNMILEKLDEVARNKRVINLDIVCGAHRVSRKVPFLFRGD